MADKTDKFASYVELLRDQKADLRAAIVASAQEDEVVSRVAGSNVADVKRKYDLDGMGN